MSQELLHQFRQVQSINSWEAFKVTCLLFKNNIDSYIACGTGVFIKIHDNHFLLTVAHVVEELDFDLYVGTTKNTMVKLGGSLVTNSTENRDSDKFDLCVLKLCEETVELISNSYSFLDIDEIAINHQFKELPLYEFVGYPASKSKFNPFKNILPLKAFRYITIAINSLDIFNKLKCNPEFNIIFNYDRKKVHNYSRKTIQQGPYLNGMSGSGIWYTPISQINVEENPRKYLVALFTEWPINGKKYLIATRIDLFTEIIRQHFNIQIARSDISFKIDK